MDNTHLNPTDSEPIIITAKDTFSVNGQSITNLDGLSPEAQEKLRKVMAKLESNPFIANALGGSGEVLTELMKQLSSKSPQNTVIKQPNSWKEEVELLTTVQNSDSDTNLNLNNNSTRSYQNNFNPNHNPAVKSDYWRHVIMIIAITAIISYLVVKYAWNGKLPF